MPVKWGDARDLLPELTKIWVFKCDTSNYTTMKPRYNESVNLIESYAVYFDTKVPANLTEMVLVTGMESIVSRARLRYIQHWLASGICS